MPSVRPPLTIRPRRVVEARGLGDPAVRRMVGLGKRARGAPQRVRTPFAPPEDWHEPQGRRGPGYAIVVRPPGRGFRHVVTPADIRRRLAQLPEHMVAPLEVVQLSRMTRKKRTYPCYGLQWGAAIYLYPMEEDLVERYSRPPRPARINEARMYGARWVQHGPREWRLVWTERAIRDYYLNNILVHELGHLLDHRNTNYADRERFAEWFAIEHGYRPSRRAELARRAASRVLRRHGKRSC